MKKYAALLLTLLLTGVTYAQTLTSRDLVSYQGQLTNAQGAYLGDPTPVQRTVQFRLYNAATAGTLRWCEQQDVTFYKGNFSVSLGSGTAIASAPSPNTLKDAFGSDADYYLELTVVTPAVGNIPATSTVITPRQRIISTPVAFRATVADRVNATTASTLGATNVTGALTLSGTSPLTFDRSLTINPSINYVAGGGDNGGLRIKAGGTSSTGKIVMEAPEGVKFTSKLDISGDLTGNQIGAKLLLWGGEAYSMGVQTSTLYFRTDMDVSFYKGGRYTTDENDAGGGTELARFEQNLAIFPKNIFLRDGVHNAHFNFDGPSAKVTLNKAFETTGAITAPSLTLTGGITVPSITQTGSDGITAQKLSFGNRLGQHIALWETPLYGLGIQSSTAYLRTDGNFMVYKGGAHNDTEFSAGGGQELLRINGADNRIAGGLGIRGRMSVSNTAGNKRAHFDILDKTNDSSGPGGVNSHTFLRISGDGLGMAAGALYYDGDNNWDSRSDRRLKKNIVSAEPVLDRLLQVRMVRYNWKAQQDGDKQHFGVIAQELEPLFPDFVNYREKLGDDPDPIRTVALSDFGLLATAALQEFHKGQAEENQNLRAQNASLEDRVAKLEAAVEALLAR
jgi:hypothetical protein